MSVIAFNILSYDVGIINAVLYKYIDVIDTFTFRALMTSSDFDMSAAVCLYQSILCFVTILISNKLVKLYDPDYALF